MKMLWLLFLGLVLIFSPAHASPEFTDAEAKRLLDRWLNEGCSQLIYLGAVLLQVGEERIQEFPEEFYKRNPDPTAFLQTWDWRTKFMYAMEERGYINIERLWADENQKWQEAHVTLTRKGEALRKLAAQKEDRAVCVKWGSGRVTRIGRNEEVRKGLDVFRIVMAIAQNKWTPEIQLLGEMREGCASSEQRKIIALLKHDPFQSEWEMVASDVANLDEDFKTTNVTKFLEQR